jgi:hypothetical protein
LATDSQAFSGELVCLPLIGGMETLLRAFCLSALWQIYQTLYLFFRIQKCSLQLPLRMQECRPLTPQDAGMIWLSMGGWDTLSSALGLQTPETSTQLLLERGAVTHLAALC